MGSKDLLDCNDLIMIHLAYILIRICLQKGLACLSIVIFVIYRLS